MENYAIDNTAEYRYINQTIIEKRTINAVDSSVFAEADRYNKIMEREYARRWRINLEFCLWSAAFLLISFAGVYVSLTKYRFWSPDIVHISVFAAEAYLILLEVYFVIIRKFRNAKMAALTGFPLIYIYPLFAVAYVANIIICHIYDKYDRSVRNLKGYPDFIKLVITTDNTRDIYGAKIAFDENAKMDNAEKVCAEKAQDNGSGAMEYL